MNTAAQMRTDAQVYCDVMQEIKMRLTVVAHAIPQIKLSDLRIPDVEFVCLQFRKILELVALGSIAPHKSSYATVRQDFHTDWNARRVLKQLKKVHPDFYPIPQQQVPTTKPGVKAEFVDLTNGFLTLDEFDDVYDKCCSVVHANNPFGAPTELKPIAEQFPDWLNKIQTLISIHHIKLINDSATWMVILNSGPDGRVIALETVPA